MKRPNGYEQAARERKVIKMLLALPPVASDAESASLADRLAAFTTDERARWASFAGCNPPSAETWARLVELTRRRRPALADPFARVS